MTDNEREELRYDIAVHQLKSVAQSGIHAMAVNYVISLLESSDYNDEELKMMLPAEKPKKPKRAKAKGF